MIEFAISRRCQAIMSSFGLRRVAQRRRGAGLDPGIFRSAVARRLLRAGDCVDFASVQAPRRNAGVNGYGNETGLQWTNLPMLQYDGANR
jgi:hypothetical protein